MTAPASSRQKEAEQVTQAYQLALAALGAQTVAQALSIWATYPTTTSAAASARWLAQTTSMVMGFRKRAIALARSYYRLARALQTGATVSDPSKKESSYTTLGDLRTEFAAQVKASRSAGAGASQSASPGTESQTPSSSSSSAAGRYENEARPDDGVQVAVEPIKNQERDEQLIEKDAESQARTILQALGPDNLDRKTSKLDTSQPAKVVDAARSTAHAEAGARQAATAARLVQNGGRSSTWTNQEKDKRAIGWVRYSTTGTPCGWCAMLISRGAVYRSQASASGKGTTGAVFAYDDGDAYHDNCKCIAVPVFSETFYKSSPLFDLNRKYAQEWPAVTKGLGGKDALSAWRRYIRTTQADTKPAVAPKPTELPRAA